MCWWENSFYQTFCKILFECFCPENCALEINWVSSLHFYHQQGHSKFRVTLLVVNHIMPGVELVLYLVSQACWKFCWQKIFPNFIVPSSSKDSQGCVSIFQEGIAGYACPTGKYNGWGLAGQRATFLRGFWGKIFLGKYWELFGAQFGLHTWRLLRIFPVGR